jgi:hypothetical protein
MEDVSELYQDFFSFLCREHNIICTISDMQEILTEANKLQEKIIKSYCEHFFPCIWNEEFDIIGYGKCEKCGEDYKN